MFIMLSVTIIIINIVNNKNADNNKTIVSSQHICTSDTRTYNIVHCFKHIIINRNANHSGTNQLIDISSITSFNSTKNEASEQNETSTQLISVDGSSSLLLLLFQTLLDMKSCSLKITTE